MRRAVLAVLAAALALAPAASGAAQGREASPFTRYEHEAGVFAIEYPASWTVFREGADQVTFYDGAAVSADDHPLVGFEVSLAPAGEEPGDAIAQLREVARLERARFGAKNPLFALREERFAVDGPLGPRCELRYEGVRKEGAEPQVAVVTFLRRGARVVRLVGKGIEARSDDFRRLYDHMALSLRFSTGAAPLQPSLSR